MNELEEIEETESTGLPFPKTWKGAYLFVLASFVMWVSLLIVLTEFGI